MYSKKILCLALMLHTVTAVSAQGNAQDYDLVWSDEFDTNTLGTNWNVEATNTPYNKEMQAYTARPENVTIADGNLVITARRESYDGKAFTSGRINSLHKVSFTHGKIEARIKLPKLANGLWPAFWMMGEDYDTVNWPKCGEIDIMEMGMKDAVANGSTANTVAGTIHWGESISSHQQYTPGSITVSQDLTDGYHIFTAVWDDNYLKFYVDNDATPYFSTTIKKGFDKSAYFHKPYHFILDLAVGGDYTGIANADAVTALPEAGDEAQMLVDYIRVYQQKDQHNVTTDINRLKAESENRELAWYNLAGQRVSNNHVGLYIHQGKKIIRNK